VRLVLASGSPRRARLLDQLGLTYVVRPPDVDETRRPEERAGDYVERLAREKARRSVDDESVVIAADTAVVHQGHILGKPAHPAEARSMLHRLQDDVHEVFTGVAVAWSDEMRSMVDVTGVKMMAMTDDEIADYIDSGEPMDKAGSYALQGRGAVFVESITGSPFTVIGLPLHLLPRLLAQAGASVHDFSSGSLSNL
jgi:septum formation protein